MISSCGIYSEYIENAVAGAARQQAEMYGVDYEMLKKIADSNPQEDTLDEGLRFQKLCDTCDTDKIQRYYNASPYQSRKRMQADLKRFLLEEIGKI